MEKIAEITGGSVLLLPLGGEIFEGDKKEIRKVGKRCIAAVLIGVLLLAQGVTMEPKEQLAEKAEHKESKVEYKESKAETISTERTSVEEIAVLPESVPNVMIPETEEPVVAHPIVEEFISEDVTSEVITEEMSGENSLAGEEISDEDSLAGEENFVEGAGETLILNGFVIDEEGLICGTDETTVAVSEGYLELPSEGCIGIRSGALTDIGAGIREVFLPSNLTLIEEGAFSGFVCLEWIEAETGNSGCISVDGVLLDGSGTKILAFPGGRTDGYIVPSGVTEIADRAFANTNITYLDLWGCEPLQIGAAIFGEQGGNGLEVRVPAAYLEWYENAFAGYDVRIL